MKKKLTLIFLMLTVLFQSCTVYQKKSTPLEESYDKGKVKVIHTYLNEQGKYSVKEYFNIVFEDSTYYGVRGSKKEIILASNSTSVYLKDSKGSKNRTVLAIAVPVGAVVGGVIYLAIACNCPYVDIIDTNNQPIFQGTLFPGAIFESLERTDQLVLDYKPNGDNVHVRISNVLPEREYINEIKMLQYQVKPKEKLALDNFGKLIAVSNLIAADVTTDMNGTSWTEEVSTADGRAYKFDDTPKDNQFNRLDLRFHVNDQMDHLNLVIRGKQTEWVEVVGDQFFSLFGNKFNKWVDRMDEVDPEKYNENATKNGLSLRVLAKIDGEFTFIGAFHNAGTKMKRDMVLNLPARLNYGSELEIRLESAYKFWEIDQVALAKNVRTEVEYKELNLSSAISNAGLDVKSQINAIDEKYAKILKTGDFIDLNFDYIQPSEGKDTRLVLKGTGYYHHEKEYSNPINKKALRALKQPYATHQFSQIIEQAYILAKNNQN